MTLSEFRSIPLLRSYIYVDTGANTLLRREVRRDPLTGLTLSLAFNLETDDYGKAGNRSSN